MDDLGDDSVQVALRVSQQMFVEWRRMSQTSSYERTRRVVATDMKRGIEGTSEDARRVDARSAETQAYAGSPETGRDPGWERVTLASDDASGIEAAFSQRGVEVMFYERFDGDVDVLFRAADEDAVSAALEEVIEEATREREPLEEQIAEAVEEESSREKSRRHAKSRNLSQEVSR